VSNRLNVYVYGITAALKDRAEHHGLMGRMSDERFMRFIARRLEEFHQARNAVTCDCGNGPIVRDGLCAACLAACVPMEEA